MDKKKSKKQIKKPRNVNDANDVILDPGKILKACERDFNNARAPEDYSAVAKKLEDFIAKQSENAKAIALFGH